MDLVDQLRRRIWAYLVVVALIENCLLLATYVVLDEMTAWAVPLVAATSLLVVTLLNLVVLHFASAYIMAPLRALWLSILHLNPSSQNVAAPDLSKLAVGQEIVTNLMSQIFQLASVAGQAADKAAKEGSDLHRNFIAQNLPLPLILIDTTQIITYANEAAAKYVGIEAEAMLGKNVYMVLDMSFPNVDTFDSWLKKVKV